MAKYNKNRFGSIVLTDNDTHQNFTITKKEQNEIKTLVKRANSKRTYYTNQMYNQVKQQANMRGVSKEVYGQLLNRKGFITEKYSTSFNQFTSKEDVKDFIKELKTVTKKGYGDRKISDIRNSMKKRASENYGESANMILEKLDELTDNEIKSLYIHNDDLIQELYGSPELTGEEVDNLANKTISDINVALRKIKGR